MQDKHERDPVYESERLRGSTPPEPGAISNDVAGRPAVEKPRTAFHEPTETPEQEREPFNQEEAVEEGGSFDAMGLPHAPTDTDS